ncbi:DUF1127 domain-containing protein [Rhodobacteraceae bacterium 2376]|uniref:DUF1127 domain-containing protein n=1 Tax=Rhabdonatronobacter sediminivivens TaxID=2743469 RepID=A0A7Z0KZB0_9RHOB|nr:DUF1127 domain-containing protein [Rhabdonatronobacter sediminivivens]NYS24233.1 DUF1127 domain-containing protein [Rhabdonatronobacter sediminivivens]
MAYVIHNTSAGGEGFVARMRDRWSRYKTYRRTYAELSNLSSRDLADLGISRNMISRLAREAADGK